MLLRILKYIILAVLFFITVVFIYFNSGENKKSSPFFSNSNSADSIVYTFDVKGGRLEIYSKKVSVGKELSYFVLDDMNANFNSANRKIKISAAKCKLYPAKKIAIFGPKVEIKGDNLFLKTNSSVLNWEERSLRGDSKLTGFNGKLKFSADGFLIKDRQKIILKHAKIIKERK